MGPGADFLASASLWAGKAVLFASLFLGIGGTLFAAVTALPEPARRFSVWLSMLGLLMAPITLGLQGLDALGLSLASIFSPNVWQAGWSTSYGATAVTLTLAFACATTASMRRARSAAAVLALVAVLLGALSLAMSGHASAAAPQWLTRPAVFLHIAGILFWVGALWPLWVLLRDQSEVATRALGIFSRVIPYAVVPLVLSGLTLGYIQMGWPGPQWISPYGGILAAKLVLLAVLFALALWNRLWLTKPALEGDPAARRRLHRSIGAEIVVVLVILALVAGWRFTPSPRAPAPLVVAEPIYTHAMSDTMMAMLTMTPGAAGPTRLELEVTDIDGNPLSPMEVDVRLSEPALGIEPFKREAVEQDGIWLVDGLTIPAAGAWLVQVDIRASAFELVKLETELEIP